MSQEFTRDTTRNRPNFGLRFCMETLDLLVQSTLLQYLCPVPQFPHLAFVFLLVDLMNLEGCKKEMYFSEYEFRI